MSNETAPKALEKPFWRWLPKLLKSGLLLLPFPPVWAYLIIAGKPSLFYHPGMIAAVAAVLFLYALLPLRFVIRKCLKILDRMHLLKPIRFLARLLLGILELLLLAWAVLLSRDSYLVPSSFYFFSVIGLFAALAFLHQRRWRPWAAFLSTGLAWIAGVIITLLAFPYILDNRMETSLNITRLIIHTTTGFALITVMLNGFLLARRTRLRYVIVKFLLAALFLSGLVLLFQSSDLAQLAVHVASAEPLEIEDDDTDQLSASLLDTPEHWQEIRLEADEKLPFKLEKNVTSATFSIAVLPNLNKDPRELPLLPTYYDALSYARRQKWDMIPSTAMIQFKTKYFGERLLASLELHLQHQSEALGGGKTALFRRMLERFSAMKETEERTTAMAYLATGLRLGGAELPELADDVITQSDSLMTAFQKDPSRSRAASFYSEDKALEAIFQQDRFLQTGMSGPVAAAFAQMLLDTPELRKCYQTALAVNACLCNPPGGCSPEDAANHPELLQSPEDLKTHLLETETGRTMLRRYPSLPNRDDIIELLPFSTARESEFFDTLYAGSPSLPRESIMNRFTRALRAGELDLTPQADSGWYDYQSFAFEPLLLTDKAQEHRKLWMNSDYKRHLIETFQVLVTQEREKHLKFLLPLFTQGDEISEYVIPSKLAVTPQIRVEPTATCYLRTARAFVFLEKTLPSLLGESEFRKIPYDGQTTVAAALAETRRLCYGLYLRLCADLGMLPKLKAGELEDNELAPALAAADAWLADIENEPAFKQDTRVAVPILVDANHKNARYWLTVGVRFCEIDIFYDDKPALRITEPGKEPLLLTEHGEMMRWFSDRKCDLTFPSRHFFLPVEVFAEANGPEKPLTRQEFRDLCDKCDSREEVITALARYGTWRIKTALVFGVVMAFVILGFALLAWKRRFAHLPEPQ